MIQARQMHPMEMKYLIPEISRATGKNPGHLARRLSQTHRHGCILLQSQPETKAAKPSDGDFDLEDDAGQAPLCGFLLYRLDHKGLTAWLLESAVYPQALPEGRGLMVRKLSDDLAAMGLNFRTAAMVPEDDSAGMDSLRRLGFKAKGLSRNHFQEGLDAFEMVLAPGGIDPGAPARTDCEKSANRDRMDSVEN
jgi:hypothetical protein